MFLSDSDMESLHGDEGYDTDGSKTKTSASDTNGTARSRIIIGNSTKAQALMINGAIGEDLWKDLSHLEIRDNVAEDDSMMVNYAISMDVFEKLLSRQDARVERERQRRRPD